MDQKELHELEYKCIQECAPWCIARCPAHVDVRAMNAAVAKGDLDLAAGVFLKKVPFPHIISHVCDHPCENVCRRADVDDALSIRALEKVVMQQASSSEVKITRLRSKNKRAAIVGGGLSGLTAAVELAKKGFDILILESSDRLGGSLWEYSEEELPRSLLNQDLELIKKVPVELRFKAALGSDVSLAELESDFDAVYIGIGPGIQLPAEIELDNEGRPIVDPVTFQTSRQGVFAGGSILTGAGDRSPIGSISGGRRAAVSMDRYMQGVSLAASRENEGAYETRLYSSVGEIEPQGRILPAEGSTDYSAEEARREAERCLQCQCLECVKVCEYLQHYKGYPRKYVRQVYNNLSIVAGQRHGNLMINSCSLCGLCQEVCPEDLHMGEVCKAARYTMMDQNRMPPSAHEFALRDMEFSNSDLVTLARHEPGMTSSTYLFFPGCQLSASSPENVGRTYTYLREKLRGGVGLMLRCCGAPADWSGRGQLFSQTLADFEAQWHALGSPTLVLACSTCLGVFSDRFSREKVVSLWEIFDRHGLPQGVDSGQVATVSVHDPCTTRHEPKIHDSVRSLLRKIGFEIRELELTREKTECCSFGGLMRFANPDLAEKVIQRRIDAAPETLLAYCAVCRDHYASHGKPTWHLLDLIFGTATGDAAVYRGPYFSQRRENRARLKAKLLREVWGEESPDYKGYRDMKLHIEDHVLQLMETRMILVEDLQKVIAWAEETGNRLVHKETGRFLAHHRPASVTYWVEYTPADDGYTIHNAYSHRMELVEEIKR